jgi:hypothetical protein
MKKTILFPILFAVLLSTNVPTTAKSESKTLIARGVVVGEIIPIHSLLKLTDVRRMDTLIIRIDKPVKGTEKSQYVIAQYKYFDDEKYGFADLNDANQQWRFKLTRELTCDCTPASLIADGQKSPLGLPRLRRTSGAESEPIPINRMLPCYSLQQRNLTPAKKTISNIKVIDK